MNDQLAGLHLVDREQIGVGARSIAEFFRRFMATMYEVRPHKVYYQCGYVTYVDAKSVLCTNIRSGPSDCIWIVPGTAEVEL